MKKAVIVSLVMIVAGGAYIALRAYNSFEEVFGCGVTVQNRTPSPGKDMVAVVFEKDCGATTPFNTQVSLARADKIFSPEDFPPFLVLRERHRIVPSWKGNHRITIHLPEGEKVYRRALTASGVTIIYD